MGTYVGVDLHSNNGYYGIIDQDDERIFQKKLPNDLPLVVSALEPFRKEVEGIVISLFLRRRRNRKISPKCRGCAGRHGPRLTRPATVK